MPSERGYSYIGIIGVVNLSLLTLINIWRTVRFVTKEDYRNGPNFYKKLAFHAFLLLATGVDLPIYVTFITAQKYTLTTYSFHKFSSAFLFAAFSITISDWSAVLYDINEYDLQPFLLRKATLVVINALYALVSITNFIFCYTLDNFDSYTSSTMYIMGIFFQISVSLILTLFMLSAGLKLAWRIHGVSGGRNDLSNPRSHRAGLLMATDRQFQQFSSALWNLNVVMATCAFCIILQTVLLVLDYALGYANSTSKTVGPLLFYWTCYFWLPLWGVTCSLLYLSRTHSKQKDVKHRDIANVESVQNGYCNPLINSTDQASNPYHFEQPATMSTYSGSVHSGVGGSVGRPHRPTDGSFDSADLGIGPGYIRESRSTLFGGSEAGLSGHTEHLFGVTDTENEHLFGAVYSPDNSLGHNYRDSSLFSPAVRESATVMFSPSVSVIGAPTRTVNT